jgi:hypothetical protein
VAVRNRDGILAVTQVPAPDVDAATIDQVVERAVRLAQSMDYVGVLCVEFFVLHDGRVLANEMAPRPHNSGHYSIDACDQSQPCAPGACPWCSSPALPAAVNPGRPVVRHASTRTPDWRRVALPGAPHLCSRLSRVGPGPPDHHRQLPRPRRRDGGGDWHFLRSDAVCRYAMVETPRSALGATVGGRAIGGLCDRDRLRPGWQGRRRSGGGAHLRGQGPAGRSPLDRACGHVGRCPGLR